MSEGVVVVGASSAGLFTAYLLAREGVPVRVYERSDRLVPIARTLIVTSDLIRTLGFVPETAIVNRVRQFEFRAGETLAHMTLPKADLIIERGELIRLLAARAVQAGAELHFGHRFVGFERNHGRTSALFEQRNRQGVVPVPARVVVGADGANSSVAKVLGQRRPRQILSVLQARVALPPGSNPRLAQVWFAPSDTPYFYWLVPESPEMAAVGLVHDDHRNVRSTLDRFLEGQELRPLEYQAALIPSYWPTGAPVGRVGSAEVLMVGDAAGQVKVTTVGGTVSGLAGARAAARSIVRASEYRQELGPLNRELRVHWLIRQLWSRFGEDEYRILLRSLDDRVQAVLQRWSRDCWAAAVLPVLATRPQLLLLGVRAVAKYGRRGHSFDCRRFAAARPRV